MRPAARCAAAFDDLPERCDGIARGHDLVPKMKTVRDVCRSMLRREAG